MADPPGKQSGGIKAKLRDEAGATANPLGIFSLRDPPQSCYEMLRIRLRCCSIVQNTSNPTMRENFVHKVTSCCRGTTEHMPSNSQQSLHHLSN